MNWDKYHPVVCAVYYLTILLIVMLTRHPVILLLAVIISVVLRYKEEHKNMIKTAGNIMGLSLIIGLINPLLSHNGETVLLFVNGKAYTLEAMLYGFLTGLMLFSVFHLCMSLSHAMTEDRLLAVLGKPFPKLALMISMILKTVPLITMKNKQMKENQILWGSAQEQDHVVKTIQSSLARYSMLISWLLENGIVTADSMDARGYGLPGRTSYRKYCFHKKDALMLTFILGTGAMLVLAIILNWIPYSIYPLYYLSFGIKNVCIYCVFILLVVWPAWLVEKQG